MYADQLAARFETMPKDKWRRANNRARYGPVGREPRTAPRRDDGEPRKRFVVPAGVRCKVKRRGDIIWRDHTTTVQSVYASREVADGGGNWLFSSGEWLLKISPKRVRVEFE